VYGFVQRSLTQTIPPTLGYNKLVSFSRDFFFSPSRFSIDFTSALNNILNTIEQQTRDINSATSQAIAHGDFSAIEIVVDDYDPDYHRFNIRLVINGVTVSFGHLNPRTGAINLAYAKVVALTFDIPRFNELAKEVPFHPDLVTLLRWVNTSTLHDWFVDFKNKFPEKWNAALSAGRTLTAQEAETNVLVDMKVIQPVDVSNASQLLIIAPTFKVPKSCGKLARSVYNGQRFDTVLQEVLKWKNLQVPPMPNLSIRTVVKQILSGWKYISSNDFTSFFFQIKIHPMLGNLLGIEVHLGNDRRFFKMIALPMGITFSPALAQHIALVLKQYLKQKIAHIDFDIVVWIDNILILTNTPEDNEFVRNEFDKLLQHLGIAAKAWEFPDPETNVITALGLEINLHQQIIKPSAKSIKKLNDAFDELSSEANPRSFFVFQGLVMWMSYFGNIPLCFMTDFMEIVRKESRWLASFTSRTATVPWYDRRSELDNGNVRTLAGSIRQRCINLIVKGPLYSLPPSLIASSDASATMIAGLTLDHKLAFSLPLVVSPRLIFLSELLAGALLSVMIRHSFPFVCPPLPWLWLTDNTIAKFAVVKGHSASPLAEEILRFWFKFGLFPSHVMWVPTDCMPADKLTRRETFATSFSELKSCELKNPGDQVHSHPVAEIPCWNLSNVK
jgi:hypothetical protein